MIPYLSREAPWFVFLIHPRDDRDLLRWGGGPILRRYSSSDDEFREKALSNPPLVVGEFRFGASPVRGELVAVPCLPDEMLHARGRRLTIEAAQLAVQRGTRVLGLGALTAPATRGGLALLPELPPTITVTTGNAYTAAVAYGNVVEASEHLGLGRAATVAVVGCTGSVGSAVSRLLAEDAFDLILIGRSAERAERLLPDLAGRARYSGSVGDVRAADVALLLTADPSARATPELVAGRGLVVVDVAQPPNVPPERYGEFAKIGVTVVEGGLASIPGFVSTQNVGVPPGSGTFACLTETYLFACEGLRDHSVGPASVELARTLVRVAARRGVRPVPLALTERDPVEAVA